MGEAAREAAARETVVDLLEEQWQAVAALARELDDAEWDLPSECPGWTVRDVLSHMVGTERGLLGEEQPVPLAEVPGHVRNELGARNEAWVAARRGLPGRRVAAEFEAVTGRRLEQLRSWPVARFDELTASPVGEVSYREFMRVRVMDCWVHEQDMRVATGRPGHDAGPAAELALGRLRSALPFVVGKQARAPEASVVRFELRGAQPMVMDVAVRAGRAVVSTDPVPEPTVVLGMDTETLWRLACGRVRGPAARMAGLVEVHGDGELATRVVDAMAFMV